MWKKHVQETWKKHEQETCGRNMCKKDVPERCARNMCKKDVQERCARKMFKKDVQERCSRKMFKKDVQERCLRNMFKKHVQERYSRNMCKKDVQERCAKKMCKKDVQETCSRKMFKRDVQERCARKMFKKHVQETCSRNLCKKDVQERCSRKMCKKDVQETCARKMCKKDVQERCSRKILQSVNTQRRQRLHMFSKGSHYDMIGTKNVVNPSETRIHLEDFEPEVDSLPIEYLPLNLSNGHCQAHDDIHLTSFRKFADSCLPNCVTLNDETIVDEDNYSLYVEGGYPPTMNKTSWDEDVTKKTSPPEVVIVPPYLSNKDVSRWTHLLSSWYLFVVLLTPIFFLPIILLIDDQYERQAKCGYTIAVMAVYWLTEALPIGVTSLIPVVVFPLLGVMTAREVSGIYFNDNSMLYVGGLTVAIALEVWDIPKRVTLLVLRLVGAEPKCLLFGITMVTWFLSMWISNTATTAMMMTIVQALIQQFRNMQTLDVEERTSLRDDSVKHDSECLEKKEQKEEAELSRLSKALSLSVAYAANIGGTASLTGTGPNLIFFAAAQKLFEEVGLDCPVTFSTWLIYGMPLSLIVVLAMYLWMVIVFLKCRGGCFLCCCGAKAKTQRLQRVKAMIKEEYRKLGGVTYAQGSVIVCFVLLIALWITRDMGGIGGWATWFKKGSVSDSTPSVVFGILMFVIPSAIPKVFTNKQNIQIPYQRVTPLLSWQQVHDKMPWSLYLLLGAGYAIAHASKVTGLSQWLGDQLILLKSLDQWLILLIISYVVCFATEVISNTAISTLMMPILAQLSISLQINPLFFMYPAAVASSFAFMLPVSTAPNAIVFASGNVRVIDM
ncbi:solute carrier family 13 member 5, partial [Biomphalaria pfeifferi]